MDWGELKKQIVSVTVSKPEQQGKGRKKFTDFLVTALFDNGAEALSRRTFDDFEWLYDRLVQEYLGIIVPVLPQRTPATPADKFSEPFVKDCQAVLQRFIERVLGHPDLLQSTHLVQFVTCNPADWKTAKEKALVEAETTSDNGGSLHSNTTNTTDSVLFIDADAASAPPDVSQKKPGMMSRWWAERTERKALNNPKYQMEENPAETKKFNDIEAYSDHLLECIEVIEENAKVLTAAYQTQAERLQTMGAAFQQLWGEHELSNTSASVMYQTVGDSWGALHKQVEGQHAFGAAFLDTPMEELKLDVVALKQALKKRKKVVYDYTVKVKESRSLQKQMDKLKSVPDLSAIAEKYYKVEHYAKAKDVQVAEAKQLTELMCSRLTRDIERFRIEFHHRMQEVLHNYHTAQAKYLTGQSQLFMDAVPAIANMKSGRTQLPSSSSSSSPTKVNMPGLKVSTNTTGTSVTVNSAVSPEHYVGQVSLPPPGTKTPPRKSAPVATPSPQSVAPPSPEKQSIPVPTFDDDDDDGAFFGTAMGGSSFDDQSSGPPPASAPPLPPPSPAPPLPPPSPQKEESEASTSAPVETSASPPKEAPPMPPPSPQKEEQEAITSPPLEPSASPDLVQENGSSESDDEED